MSEDGYVIELARKGEMDDKPHDECGVLGVYAPGKDVARLAFFSLYALQHRGQEAAGIVACNAGTMHMHKGMGLVGGVFNEDNLGQIVGSHAIGHTRYSTTGAPKLRNTQPYTLETKDGPLALAHNGNLINGSLLRQQLLETGVGLSTSTDSEVLIHMLARQTGTTWMERISKVMEQAEGGYSLAILTREGIYGARDPWGLRPLAVGRLDGGYVMASESCAFATIGAHMEREIRAGEIIELGKDGLVSRQGLEARGAAFCTFEEIYFARPDSVLGGRLVHQTRQAIGRELAREAPLRGADLVIGVPDSGTPHAIGYATESGIVYGEGFVKSRYIGRTFIEPTDELRKRGIEMKFNALPENLSGRRVVMVDDSIVRGNTSGSLVRMLREGGASEVHVRVACPMISDPCFMGVDMASKDELIAAKMSKEEMRNYIGADSLEFISLEGLMKALGQRDGYCNACFTGKYPLAIPEVLRDLKAKEKFMSVWGD